MFDVYRTSWEFLKVSTEGLFFEFDSFLLNFED